MENDDPIIMITAEQDGKQKNSDYWLNSFINRPVQQVLTQPVGQEELAFQGVVLKYAKTLKQVIISTIPGYTSSSQFCDTLEKYSRNLPEICLDFETTPDSLNPFLRQESEPSMQIVFSPFFESSAAGLEKESEICGFECSLYRKVLSIFNLENQTEADLHSFMDVSRSGRITALELRAGLRRCGFVISEEENLEVFKILDGDKDGFVTVDDLKKRKKFIEQKAFDEIDDPLSCLVISEPLNSQAIHGCLSLHVYRVSGLKGGPRCLKIGMKNNLEYTSTDFYDNNFLAGYKYEYLLENQNPVSITDSIDFSLFNKKTILEGFCTFNWTKTHSLFSNFSYKTKIDLRTSLGQSKGSVSFEVRWTATIPPVLSPESLQALLNLKEKVSKRQEELQNKQVHFRSNSRKLTEGFPLHRESDSYLDDASKEVKECKKDQIFMINVKTVSFERDKVGSERKKTIGLSGSGNQSFSGLRAGRKMTVGVRPKTPQMVDRNSYGFERYLNVSIDKSPLNNSFSY